MKKKITFTPNTLLVIFILINFVVGLFIVPDFGRSVDEASDEARAIYALNGMSSWEKFQNYREKDKTSNASTPSIIFLLIEKLFSNFLDFSPDVVKHYLIFLFFQIGVVSFYIIAKFFMNPWSALGATIIFCTQPLYFGHAFINPKDIPFMSVFLATLASGLYMTDRLEILTMYPGGLDRNQFRDTIKEDWRNLPKRKRKILLYGISMWPLAYIIYKITPIFIEHFIVTVYSSKESILYRLFFQIASESYSTPATAYIDKAIHVFNRGLLFILVIYLIIEIILLLRFFPTIKQRLELSIFKPNYVSIMHNTRSYLLPLTLAGVLWGLCISSRKDGQAIGVIAGGMVVLYLFLKIKEKAFIPLIIYSFIAGMSLYLFWPDIWFSGFSGLYQAMKSTSQFVWKGSVLFNGEVISYLKIPRSYLPHLILIQFTEPVIIMDFLGILLGAIKAKKRNIDSSKFFILCCWLFLPIIYSVIFQPTHYNNFRQYLFMTPPLFIFTGISFNEIIKLVKKNWIGIILLILVTFPGVYSLIQLHPYQYIYYNMFVGGVEGAFRRYDLDYWSTSHKEAVEYLNHHAPYGASVIYWKKGGLVEYYARDDLEVINQLEMGNRSIMEFDYGIVPSILNADLSNLVFAETIYQVERDNAVLVEVRKIK